jgi:DNA-binding NarL/FixJ family response regulator
MYMRPVDDQAQRATMIRQLTDQKTALNVVCQSSDPRDLMAQTQTVHLDLVLLDQETSGSLGAHLLLALYCLGYPLKQVA